MRAVADGKRREAKANIRRLADYRVGTTDRYGCCTSNYKDTEISCNGDGHWQRLTQGRSQEAVTTADQNDGPEDMDKAQPHERRVLVSEKAGREEIQGRSARAVLSYG